MITSLGFLGSLNSPKNNLRILTTLVFIFAILIYLLSPFLHGDLDILPIKGDGPDYDAIAVQLTKGNGFSFNWDDNDFLSVYKLHNASGQYSYLFERHGSAETAYRPPLFPLLMATTFKIFGRTFTPIVVFNCIFMALACTISAYIAGRTSGYIPGIICAALFLFDTRTQFYSRVILTESLACFLTAFFSWSIFQTIEKKTMTWACISGLSLALGYLSRSIFVLWAPVMAVLVYILTKPIGIPWISFKSLRLTFIFLASFVLLSSPWMIRNCILLDGFTPLGTQGAINLSSAYCDTALSNRGAFTSIFRDSDFSKKLNSSNLPGLEREKIAADYNTGMAIKWIRDNVSKLPLLAYYKVTNEWKPRSQVQLFSIITGIVGLLVMILLRREDAATIFGILFANTLAVAITYSDDGRFLIPVLPLTMALSAIGIWSMIVACVCLPMVGFNCWNRTK